VREFTCKLDEIDTVLKTLFEMLKEGGVVILQGDLAAGKTTFVQYAARFLGLSEAVTSPTFSIQHCYEDKLFHYDIYNQGIEHFLSLGLLEELEREGYHFVEWGDKKLYDILKLAQIKVLIIQIEKEEGQRKYRIIDA
jgi:tRNA threonylcarbamoyladenosine biosynthesis protein TsaE